MFLLHDIVRVKKDYPELSLTPNNVGTVVDIHNDGDAYTVEFIDENLETIEEALYTEFSESELEKVTIVHGLDLPNEVAERNALIMMKQLGITKEDIENCEIDDKDYLCYQEKDDNFEEIKKQYQTKTPTEWEDKYEKEKERLKELKETIQEYDGYKIHPPKSFSKEELKVLEEERIKRIEKILEANQHLLKREK